MSLETSTERNSRSTFSQEVAAAIRDMVYLSEAEEPLELMNWPEVPVQASLMQRITAEWPGSVCSALHPLHFFGDIGRQVVQGDAALAHYVDQYNRLFQLFKTWGAELQIIRVETRPIGIFIGAFTADESVVIKIVSIET